MDKKAPASGSNSPSAKFLEQDGIGRPASFCFSRLRCYGRPFFIARALLEFNVELRKKLKGEGLLSRDARGKERKKYGQKGARKRFQFSKR